MVVIFTVMGCSKGEDKVDVNPGKGDDGVGNPARPGDQGDNPGADR